MPIVSTFWGDPAPYVERLHETGAVHIHTAGTLAEALAAVRAGVDVLVALVAAEANVHPEYRDRLIAANASDTVLGTVFDKGWSNAPHRTLRNGTVTAWEAAGRPPAPNRPGEEDVVGESPSATPLVRYRFGLPV